MLTITLLTLGSELASQNTDSSLIKVAVILALEALAMSQSSLLCTI